MSSTVEIKKLYYAPVKSFNFIEQDQCTIVNNIGIQHDRVFALLRNKTKEQAIQFQNKQYLRNNQSYLSVKNTPILNHYQVQFDSTSLRIYHKGQLIAHITDFDFESLQQVSTAIKAREESLQHQELYFVHNQTIPFYDMINDHLISLINLASVRDFAARSGLIIDHERFRANIVIDGMPAFAELELAKQIISIGSVRFQVFSNIPRCKATNYPYKQIVADHNIPQQLHEIYDHIDFGIYLKPLENGVISLSNQLQVLG